MTVESHSILAIDHGERRIGIAFKPPGSSVALPLEIIPVDSTDGAIKRILEILAERRIEVVVVGLPVHPNPGQARRVRRFTRKLREQVRGVRWRFTDERLTSEEAAQKRREAGLDAPDRGLDDQAAALILESYILNPS